MIGSFRWNFIAGAVGFLGTLAVSLPQNLWKTALTQSVYSFLFLFFFLFVVRWVLGILVQASGAARIQDAQSAENQTGPGSSKGLSIDFSTPDENPAFSAPTNQQNGTEPDSGFTPLNPPKLTTKLENHPEELVKAVRRMSEE